MGKMDYSQAIDQAQELGMTYGEAAAYVSGIVNRMKKLDGMVATAYVEIVTTGSVPSGSGGSGKVRQAGGDFIVPPQFTGDTFPVRATAGERVQVDTASKTKQDELMAMFAQWGFADRIGKAVGQELISKGVVG